MTKSVRVAVMGALIVAGAIGCGAPNTSPPTATGQPTATSTTTATAPTAAAPTTTAAPTAAASTTTAPDPEPCTTLGGVIDTNQICGVYIATDTYFVAMSFPVDYPDQRALVDFLADSRDSFLEVVGERPPREFPYELSIEAATYRSGTPSADTRSVVFTMYSDSGGAHPVTNFQSFNYAVGQRVPITFDTLFTPGSQPVDVLNPIVGRQLAAFWEDSSNPMPDEPPGAAAYQVFAITDDAVIFFLSQGLWLPQVAGPREVSVPRSDLASILSI